MKFGSVKHKCLLHINQASKLPLQAVESKAVVRLSSYGCLLLYQLSSYLGQMSEIKQYVITECMLIMC